MRQLLPLIGNRFHVHHLGALSSLSTNRLISFAGESIIGLFLPIFIFEYFSLDLSLLILWFIVAHALRLPLLVLAAKQFQRIGLVASMTIGTVGMTIFYGLTIVLDVAPLWHPWIILSTALVIQAVAITTYWTPFHVDFTRFSKKGHRGREVGILYAAKDLISMIGPVVGGVLIARLGYEAMFVVAALIILLSLIPLAYLPRVEATYEFGFIESFKKLFHPTYRTMTLSMMAYGAEGIVATIFWPVFLFSVFAGQYLDLGIFAGAIVVVNILLRLGLGLWLDAHARKRMLRLGVDLYALGWLAKAFVTSVTGVFAAATFHGFGSIMMRTPLDVMTYEKAADAGHYLDEFTTLREIALSLGRIAMLLVAWPVVLKLPLSSTFVLAAVVSFGITLFAKYRFKEILPNATV